MAIAGRLLAPCLLLVGACAAPTLTQDGQLVFSQGGQHGATVITANGVQFVDRTDMPQPIARLSPYEPWRPPTGFLLPDVGLWSRVSEPLVVHGDGVDFEVRASDTYAPSWGGEIFLRVEITAPRGKGAPAPRDLVVVLDDHGEASRGLLSEVLARLGAGDRVGLVDAGGAELVVPLVSAGRRTLVEAAASIRGTRAGEPPDIGGALAKAAELFEDEPRTSVRQVVLLTDGSRGFADVASIRTGIARLAASNARVTAAATGPLASRNALAIFDGDRKSGGAYPTGSAAISAAIAERTAIAASAFTLRIASAPAPARALEASGGELVTTIDEDMLLLGDVHEGDARAEVLRVALPVFVPREELSLSIDASWFDRNGTTSHHSHGTLSLRYTDDVATLGRERNADVLADAAAMGAVHRLGREGFGASGAFDAFLHVATWASMSLDRIGRDRRDASLVADAAVLKTVVGASR